MNIAEAVASVRQGSSKSVMVKCPAHDDGQASLHVSAGTEQPVLLRCHAGCDTASIIAESGIDWNEVCKPMDVERMAPVSRVGTITYSYTDEDGVELFQAIRYVLSNGRKEFRQRHRVGTEWVWNLNNVRRVLYHLPAVIAAVNAGTEVWVVEGEKDVHTAEARGLVATCNPMGAGKWQPEYSEMLRGATVRIVADADVPGRRHAREVAVALRAVDCNVTVYESGLPNCKDLTDHIAAGGTRNDLIETGTSEDSQPVPQFFIPALSIVTMTFDDEQFVIPDTLAREERLLITGFEGHGKSTLLRQIAVQVAAGIHPWTLRDMPPQRVLLIDAENAIRQSQGSWLWLFHLAESHGHPVDQTRLMFSDVHDSQPDLTSPLGREWFLDCVNAARPDIILLGPIQNLTGRDVKDDDVVRKFKRTIDDCRSICGSAVVMEHHPPHKAPGDSERSVRPYGSSLFLKWPDYGYGLRPTEEKGTFDWQKFRWPRVRDRVYPERLRNGVPGSMEWPWMPEDDVSGSTTVKR